MNDEFNWPIILTLLAFCVWAIFEMHSCDIEHESPEYKAKIATQEKACLTPVLVAEKDDVQLYAINYGDCGHNVVYFSKSGTHTKHTERHGKTSETVDDDVSNAGNDQ